MRSFAGIRVRRAGPQFASPMRIVQSGGGLVVALGLSMAGVAEEEDWVVENASGLLWFEDMQPRHMVVNSAERPCAAFGGDQLYFAKFNGSIWQWETVDDARGVAGVGAGDMLKLRIGVRNRFPDSDRSSERHRYSGPQLAADRGHPEGQSLYEAITRFQWVCTMGLLAGNLIAGLFASSNGTESRLRRSSGR